MTRVRILDVPAEKRGWRGGLLAVGQELDLPPQAASILLLREAAVEVDAVIESMVTDGQRTAVIQRPKGRKRGNTANVQRKKNG